MARKRFDILLRSLGWTATLVVTLYAAQRATAVPPAPGEAKELANRIEQLVTAQAHLWYPRAVDNVRGGFHQNYGRDWTELPDDDRFLVYQSRMTWTAAALAEFVPHEHDTYLEYARHGLRYLDEVMRDREQGGFYFALTVDGEPLSMGRTSKHAYGTAFVIYAAMKAFEVTHDQRGLVVARDAMDWLETHARDQVEGGYHEAFLRDGTPIRGWSENSPITDRFDPLGGYYGYKSMNSHIHLLESLSEYHRLAPTPLVRERLHETLTIVRDRIAVEPGALNLFFAPTWRAVPAHDSFGHDIETAYLMVEAASSLQVPNDAPTWTMARRLVDHALEWGWDEEHGGFYDRGESFATAFDRDKVWWVQAEGLNALLLMHRRFGHETDRYWEAFHKQWEFIARHQLDSEHGDWFERTTREGELIGTGQKASRWKANYHSLRALMNSVRWLRELP